MKHFNQVTLIGNLGKLGKTGGQEKKRWASFSMVTEENWKDQSGEWQSRPSWHNCMCKSYAADNIQNAEPGDTIVVTGAYKQSTKENGGMYVDVRDLRVFKKPVKSESEAATSAEPADEDDSDLPF